MDIDVLLNELFSEIPEMEDLFRISCDLYHVHPSDERGLIWSLGVMDNVVFLLREGEEYKELTKRIFSFFEKIATQNDETLLFFLQATVNYLYINTDIQKKALQFMGTATRKHWDNYCKFMKDLRLMELATLYSDEEMDELGIHYEYLH